MSERTARAVLIALALPQIAIAAWASILPKGFFSQIADFGAYDAHFVYDYATFSAAVGFSLLASVWRSSWRRGALVVAALWSALHAVNHILDYSAAHTVWIAAASLALLLASAILFALAAAMIPEHGRQA